MNILLHKVRIADSSSPYHLSQKDILICNGIIQQIEDHINNNTDKDDLQVIEGENIIASQGWVDVFSHFTDPGFEHRETLETGANTAASGGYTHVFTLPNTQPVIQNKTQVEYIVRKSQTLPINILPLGAITQNTEGNNLAEMYDMYHSGAVAFSDGINPVQSPGLLLKALQYVKAFNGIVVQLPLDKSIGAYGLVNEGIISTQLGLPGIPPLAEELIVQRDIELLRYTNSRLHITGISTAKSIELIRQAKKEGLQITCSATPYHLYFTDEDLQGYDTNLKVNPPLRTRADRDALRKAVIEGDIDMISAHHLPQHWDNKSCEFEYAKNGMISLQTAFTATLSALPSLTEVQVAALFSENARKQFGLQPASIKEGETADITLFNLTGRTNFTKSSNKSKSSNSPFFDKELKGVVIGIINKENTILN